MDKIISILENQQEEYLELLKNLVSIDCQSTDIEGVNKIGDLLKSKFIKLGKEYNIKTIEQEKCGNHILITRKGRIPGKILIIGHMDTVYPKGTITKRPFKIKENYAYGPGVSDMKNGIASIYHALKTLDTLYKDDVKTIEVLFNSDEEIGSIYSKEYIKKYAKDADYALILESARENGNVVTARKGVSRYKVKSYGQAAHSGTSHHKGCNAIVALSHKIITLSKLTDYEKKTTLNVGVIQGGTTSNTVPDYCEAIIDVRTVSIEESKRIDKAIKEICNKSEVKGTIIHVEGGLTRPPMEKLQGNNELYNLVKKIGESIGLNIGETFAGGGSDGNFTTYIGTPTIDGLGPIGGGDHSEKEYLDIKSIVPRTALLVKLIKCLS